MLDQLRLTIPGRGGDAHRGDAAAEVGAANSFLLSDRSSHLSGVVLPVDGGFLA